jgi:hypothetical protein
MWRLFRKRQADDLSRLVSAYRFFLKVSRQNQADALEPWRGAFGQVYQQFFKDWPSPNESRKFEKRMLHRLKKTVDVPRAFILAINDYLDQKPLSPEELDEVVERGREVINRS